MPTYRCPDCMKTLSTRRNWIAHMKRCKAPKSR